MQTADQDIVELFDFAWTRLSDRMEGLTDTEWSWCPTQVAEISLRWRLAHITELLSEARNWTWLGQEPPANAPNNEHPSASAALAALHDAYAQWRGLITGPDADLSQPIGAAAGPYGDASRRSFVLHVADELIHHGAEAALLRDLYAAQQPTT